MIRCAIFLTGLVISVQGSVALAADCPGPYRVENANGSCVWSCGQGTRPDPTSNVCRCEAGLKKAGTDLFGRLICVKQAAGSKSSGVMKKIKRYAKRYPANTRPTDLCSGFEDLSAPDWPVRRKTRTAPVRFKSLRPMELIVRRS